MIQATHKLLQIHIKYFYKMKWNFAIYIQEMFFFLLYNKKLIIIIIYIMIKIIYKSSEKYIKLK